MRLLILIFLLILTPYLVVSQNLVPNWSFEDTLSCPTNQGQINKAKHWFTPRGGGGTSELFHSCSNYSVPSMSYPNYSSIPKNVYGYQYPKLGNAYAGIGTFVQNDPLTKEYAEVRLNNSLNPQINYYIEFWVCLSEKSNYAIENIGVYFSKDTVHYYPNPSLIMNLLAQVEYSGGIISDTSNWTKVSGYFKPNEDGYQFITIGNFNTNDSTNIQYLSSGTKGWAYYYIDNVVVIDSALQHTIGISDVHNNQVIKFEVFPNPTQVGFTINLDSFDYQEIEVSVFDLFGRALFTERRNTNETLNFNHLSLSSGTYIIRVSNSKGIFGNRKLVVL